ncbi:MAG: M15 family metallopeptidase [Akkermansiaceae bacterium]|nr:M15 family metallopeptidase [Akkermansiaceae bacterium]
MKTRSPANSAGFPLRCAGLILAGALATGLAKREPTHRLPDGFVDVTEVIPGVRLELRYLTVNNFIGQPVDGYLQPRAILTEEAAGALAGVQKELEPFGFGLKIFDAYRPQRAVDHFVRWAEDPEDIRMKKLYYPGVAKKDLFKEEYIADRSSHTRGSTVDVTLVSRDGRDLDMGSGFDFFDPKSWPTEQAIPPAARAHRLLLATLMIKHGFQPYSREWWHFTLRNEPFPDTYFDFPVE